MSCSNCKEVIDPNIPFAEFNYTPTRKVEQNALIRLPNKPSRGWSVVFPVKGSPQTVDGVNPRQVAHNAVELYRLNGFQVDKNALWFNLNIQWLERTPAKYHTVPLAHLLEIANPENVVNDDKHANQKTNPDDWSHHFWKFLRAYTDSETYEWDTFRAFLKQYQRMLNPAENALLGNSSWYVRFTLAFDKIERNPAYTSDKAKLWVNEQI